MWRGRQQRLCVCPSRRLREREELDGRAGPPVLRWGRRGAALSSERGGSQWAKLHAHHHWAGNREGTPGEKAPVRNSGWQRDFGGIMILSNQL